MVSGDFPLRQGAGGEARRSIDLRVGDYKRIPRRGVFRYAHAGRDPGRTGRDADLDRLLQHPHSTRFRADRQSRGGPIRGEGGRRGSLVGHA